MEQRVINVTAKGGDFATNEPTYYNVAIYCRLSRDDEKFGNSISIQNQRTLLTEYVQENGWRIADCYIDEGVSGTTFERDGFKRMIGDIEQGKINLVISKDLSRLGRDYLKTGYYTEVFFPEHNVRYIALNDGIDTLNRNTAIIPIKNILNEIYAKEISCKIKASMSAKFERGEHHGACVPFGYALDRSSKKLIIDEKSAETVRLIFSLSVQGYGALRVRNALIEGKHLTPSAYLHSQNPKYYAKKYENAGEQSLYEWSTDMVQRILKNEAYIGNTVHYKEKPATFKVSRRQNNPKDQWLQMKHTHEPIIDLDDWEAVQNRVQNHSRLTRTSPESVLGKTVRCADCERLMYLFPIRKKKSGGIMGTGLRYMLCTTYLGYGKTKCRTHNINYNRLCELILEDIRYYAKLALDNPTKLIKALSKSDNEQKQADNRITRCDYESTVKRLSEVERLMQRLFEESAAGILSNANYAVLVEKYQQEQAVLTEKANELAAQLKAKENNACSSEKWTALIAKYADLKELNANIVEALCEKILVHQAETINGARVQKIEIFYNFIGEAPIIEPERGRK